MTDPTHARLDEIEQRFDDRYSDRKTLMAALRAVLALHPPMRWYEECTGEFDTAERTCPTPEDDHFYVGDDGILTCEANRVQDVCAHCSDETDHERRVEFPCPTVKVIADVLGVEL